MLMFDDSDIYFKTALDVARRLRAAGHQVLFAGGCVRDSLLKRPVKDIDIATSAHPEAVEEVFSGATHAVGKAFGVIVVHAGDTHFEVATFRADGEYRDGRRPESIRYADAMADARRRDFTINGLFYDPFQKEVLDFVEGRRDLLLKVIRTIGDPSERFEEDSLRLLRAIRFAAVLGFEIEPETAMSIQRHSHSLGRVSPERIGKEFTRILTESPKPSYAMELLYRLGLLRRFLPETADLRHTPQPPRFHPEGDVWTHTMMMLDSLPRPPSPELAYGVLLHDIGKPPTTVVRYDAHWQPIIRSPNHAAIGAAMSQEILARLKQPKDLQLHVTELVRRHMSFPDLPNMRPAKLRRFIGAPTFDDDLELHRLDASCSSGDLSLYDFAKAKAAEYEAEPALPEAWIMGRDLIARGMRPGVTMGTWLEKAYEYQLENRCRSKAELLDLIVSQWRLSTAKTSDRK